MYCVLYIERNLRIEILIKSIYFNSFKQNEISCHWHEVPYAMFEFFVSFIGFLQNFAVS